MSARQMALDALIKARRELHACQAVIHLAGGFDTAYVDDALSAIKEMDKAIAALEAEIAQPVEPTNEEFENLWEKHNGHPADFAADVLESWGGWSSGVLGYGGSLNKKPEPLYAEPKEPAVNAELLEALRMVIHGIERGSVKSKSIMLGDENSEQLKIVSLHELLSGVVAKATGSAK